MRVSWTQHRSMARDSSARAEHLCTKVRTLKAAGLKEHRGRPAGRSGLGESWMPSEGDCERKGTGHSPATLPLAWSTAVPEECMEIGWEEE